MFEEGFLGQRFSATVQSLHAESGVARVCFDELLADEEAGGGKLVEDKAFALLRPKPPQETASLHRAEWLASLHEGSLLDAYVQDAWWEATHQGAVSLLQGEDEEKLHLLVIDGFPERYVCRDEKIRPRWELVDSNDGSYDWTTADS